MSEQKDKSGAKPVDLDKQREMMTKQKDKCPDCKGTGRGQFYFNKNAPCDTCHGTGGLDRPDREKIHNILSDYAYVREEAFVKGETATATPYINQIKALFPDIEELQKWYDGLLTEFKRLKRERVIYIEEAKKQEKQRVMDILQKEYPAIDTWQCWKELKR